MSRRSILTALLVAHVALLSGCGVWNLAYVPGDLSRARERGPNITPRSADGPVESTLYRAAHESGQLGFLAETARPEDDLKQLARRCDGGEDLACGRLGTPFVFFLEEWALGISLWQRACDAGSIRSCRVLADFLSRKYVDEYEPERAAELYERVCTGKAPIGRACWPAAQRHRRARSDLFFSYADMACEAGSYKARGALVKFTERRDAQLAEYYRKGALTPEIAAAKRRFGRALEEQVFASQVNKTLADYQYSDYQSLELERCRQLAAREPRFSCRHLEPPRYSLGPPPWRPQGEVPKSCLACKSRCARPEGDADSRRRCFCACATAAGGCAIDGKVLKHCVSQGDELPAAARPASGAAR